jgi:hypothetical protein
VLLDAARSGPRGVRAAVRPHAEKARSGSVRETST